jgi:uncharacterized peroxidase-related enzyme
MPRIQPLPRAELSELEKGFAATEARMGFVPNSVLTMALRPEIAKAFGALATTVLGPGVVPLDLKNMISQVCSRAAGCAYCMAHTAHTAERLGVGDVKEAALWEYETSPLYSEAERAALRVAQGAGQVPNAVTDADFAALKQHFSDEQIVEIVAVISVFGYLNRWNDTMATELEASPIAAGRKFLSSRGWRTGKHGAPAGAAKAAE